MESNATVFEPTAVESEILQERVATLARIANTLAAHVREAQQAHDALGRASAFDRPELERRVQELADVVRTWYWYLLVQREANGLRHHHGLAEHYRIEKLTGSI